MKAEQKDAVDRSCLNSGTAEKLKIVSLPIENNLLA